MKLRVAAYCRVSTDKDDQANSLENQKRYFTEYILRNSNWSLVNIYADEGISGTNTKKRIAFNQMITDANNNKIDLILTKEISRFARNTLDSIFYTRELKKLGIGVIFINDNINTLDADSELRLTIMSSIAQEESRKTSERVKWGQKRRMEQGVVFGRELLGYNLTNGVLTINQEEAEVVKKIFNKFYFDGKGTHIIARELYEEGIQPKRRVKRWSNTMILKVLRNEKYVGDLAQKKTLTPDYLSHDKICNKGQEELVYIKNHHEPIIDKFLWDAVQEELERRSPSEEQKQKHSNRYWCSGKLVCGICGSKFVSRTKTLKNGEKYKAWRCYEAAIHGNKKIDSHGNITGCNGRYINHIALNNVIQYILSNINLNRDSIIIDLVSQIKSLTGDVQIEKTDTLQKSIEALKRKKQEVINLVIEGAISKNDMVLMNQKYDEEIAQVEAKISEIKNINSIRESQANSLQKYIDRITEIADLEDFSEEVFKKVVDKIVIFQDTVLEVYITGLSEPIKIHYKLSGKNGNYKMSYRIH